MVILVGVGSIWAGACTPSMCCAEALWLASGPAGIWCGSEHAHSQLCDLGQLPNLCALVTTHVSEVADGRHRVGLPCERDESTV